jgi:hypothetical protein
MYTTDQCSNGAAAPKRFGLPFFVFSFFCYNENASIALLYSVERKMSRWLRMVCC